MSGTHDILFAQHEFVASESFRIVAAHFQVFPVHIISVYGKNGKNVRHRVLDVRYLEYVTFCLRNSNLLLLVKFFGELWQYIFRFSRCINIIGVCRKR